MDGSRVLRIFGLVLLGGVLGLAPISAGVSGLEGKPALASGGGEDAKNNNGIGNGPESGPAPGNSGSNPSPNASDKARSLFLVPGR